MSELSDILRNHAKEKLARGEVVASMTVRLCRTIEIAQIAKTSGFDTLYVDMEHNTLSIDATCQICIAAQQIGITPLVRVPANSPEYICRVLDGGAMGVITPHIRSAAEARDMVKLVKFAPLGERSSGGALSHYQYRSFPLAETNAAMNAATMLVVMLETVAALEHVEEIIAVDGVDMLLVGSNDLCNEMGITGQYDHPRLRDAFSRAIAAARGRKACRRRRPGVAQRPDDAVRQDGCALCLDRHRHGVPDRGLRAEGEVRARHRHVVAASSGGTQWPRSGPHRAHAGTAPRRDGDRTGVVAKRIISTHPAARRRCSFPWRRSPGRSRSVSPSRARRPARKFGTAWSPAMRSPCL